MVLMIHLSVELVKEEVSRMQNTLRNSVLAIALVQVQSDNFLWCGMGVGLDVDTSHTTIMCYHEYRTKANSLHSDIPSCLFTLLPISLRRLTCKPLWSLISVKIRSSSYDDCHRFWSSVFDYRQHADFNAVLSFHFFRCVLTTELHLVVSIQLLLWARWFQCGPQFSVFSLCADGQTHIRSLTTKCNSVVSTQRKNWKLRTALKSACWR